MQRLCYWAHQHDRLTLKRKRRTFTVVTPKYVFTAYIVTITYTRRAHSAATKVGCAVGKCIYIIVACASDVPCWLRSACTRFLSSHDALSRPNRPDPPLSSRYMKYLYPYECEKRRLSTPAELQAAIDGNRREGRRSSYGQYETVQRSPNPSQMSPLSLVTQQQQQQIAARMSSVIGIHNGAHHPSHPQPMGQPLNGGPMAGLAPNEFETRMMEYMKLLNKEIRGSAVTPPVRQVRMEKVLEGLGSGVNAVRLRTAAIG